MSLVAKVLIKCSEPKEHRLDKGKRICELIILQSLNESLELVFRDLQLLDQDLNEASRAVLHFRCRNLEQHDEEVARGETRAVLDHLA